MYRNVHNNQKRTVSRGKEDHSHSLFRTHTQTHSCSQCALTDLLVFVRRHAVLVRFRKLSPLYLPSIKFKYRDNTVLSKLVPTLFRGVHNFIQLAQCIVHIRWGYRLELNDRISEPASDQEGESHFCFPNFVSTPEITLKNIIPRSTPKTKITFFGENEMEAVNAHTLIFKFLRADFYGQTKLKEWMTKNVSTRHTIQSVTDTHMYRSTWTIREVVQPNWNCQAIALVTQLVLIETNQK